MKFKQKQKFGKYMFEGSLMTFEQQQAGELRLIAKGLSSRVNKMYEGLSQSQKLDGAYMQGLHEIDGAILNIYAAARRFEGAL